MPATYYTYRSRFTSRPPQGTSLGGNYLSDVTKRGPRRAPVKMAKIDWQSVLADHDRWLRTVVHARLGEPAAVDDVMQEVALAAVRQQAPLADREKVAPWLYRLAVRQALLHRRKAGRRRKLVSRFAQRGAAPRAEVSADPLGWLVALERRQLLRRAMARLSRKEAEILLLKYTEDWSYQQLAARLGTTTSAVESRLHRARQRLRDELTALEQQESAVAGATR